jgi:GABA(A) receptor-associated protein
MDTEKAYSKSNDFNDSILNVFSELKESVTHDISYKLKKPFYERYEESKKIKEKFPGRIPVIVERAGRCDIPQIDKIKYLVPADLTVGQFIYIIRKRLTLSADKALFLFIDGSTLPTVNSSFSELYATYKYNDGFLYLVYSGESTFG